MIGEPLIRPESFKNAMIEPEKVIAPIATPKPSSTRDTYKMLPAASTIPNADGFKYAEAPTSTAAKPTSE